MDCLVDLVQFWVHLGLGLVIGTDACEFECSNLNLFVQ